MTAYSLLIPVSRRFVYRHGFNIFSTLFVLHGEPHEWLCSKDLDAFMIERVREAIADRKITSDVEKYSSAIWSLPKKTSEILEISTGHWVNTCEIPPFEKGS